MGSKKISLLFFLLFIKTTFAQILTKEDSLNAGLIAKNNTTILSSYGEAQVKYDATINEATANLTRAIIFFGHRFNNKFQFFSEWELENAKVSSGKPIGSFSLEQLFIKQSLNRNNYLQIGLFIPRIGLINENHLPTTFNGNDRHYIEQELIPATWRELGIGLYGTIENIPGLNFSLAIVNGLDASKITNGKSIVNARGAGSMSLSKNIASTAALLYYSNNWRLQTSAYIGGTSGFNNRMADSLQLTTGAFALPFLLVEANAIYRKNGFGFKGLATITQYKSAEKINIAFGNNIPVSMIGGLAEISYDLFYKTKLAGQSLIVFSRFENYNLNYKIASNGIETGENVKQHLIVGFTYAPIKGIVFKLDYRNQQTNEPNKQLIINPFPQLQPYYTNRNFITLGCGYSF